MARGAPLLLAALLGILLGWSWGRDAHSDGVPTTAATAPSQKAAEDQDDEEKSAQAGADAPGQDTKLTIHAADFVAAVRALKDLTTAERTRKVRELARAIPVAELPAALEIERQALEAGKENSYDTRELICALANRWAEVDPREAGAFGWTWKEGDAKRSFLSALMGKWESKNFAGASAWLQAQPAGATRDSLIPMIATMVAKTDPKAAMAMARSMSSDGAAQNLECQLIVNWLHSDPASAATAAIECKIGDRKLFDHGQPLPYGGDTVGEIWARHDPPAALAWVSEHATARNEVIGNICRAWAKREPAAALAWVLQSDEKTIRMDVIKTAVSGLAEKDLPAALSQARALPAGEQRDAALAAAVQGAAKANPQAAAQLLGEIPAGTGRDNAAMQICQSWAATDPRAALNWLFQSAPPPAGSMSGDAFGGIIKKWLTKDAGQVAAWAQSLPAGESRDAALDSVVAVMAPVNLPLAQLLFEKLPPQVQGRAAAALAEQYVSIDFDGARDWAAGLPPGPGQAVAMAKVAEVGFGIDPQETAQWINTLAHGPGRDGAIMAVSGSMRYEDPDGAVSWALSISDPLDRVDSLEKVSYQNLTARALINSATQLTAEEKAHLLSQ